MLPNRILDPFLQVRGDRRTHQFYFKSVRMVHACSDDLGLSGRGESHHARILRFLACTLQRKYCHTAAT